MPAAHDVHEPVHISGPPVEHNEGDLVVVHPVLSNQDQSHNVEHIGSVEHAEIVPAPAAMVSDEVRCGLVEKLVLLLHDGLLLAEGTDHSRAAHTLIEVAVDRAP